MNDGKPVAGLRAGPGVFFLQADHVEPGTVFEVDGEQFEVGSELVPVGTGVYLAQLLTPDGQQLGAQLHVGRRIE